MSDTSGEKFPGEEKAAEDFVDRWMRREKMQEGLLRMRIEGIVPGLTDEQYKQLRDAFSAHFRRGWTAGW